MPRTKKIYSAHTDSYQLLKVESVVLLSQSVFCTLWADLKISVHKLFLCFFSHVCSVWGLAKFKKRLLLKNTNVIEVRYEIQTLTSSKKTVPKSNHQPIFIKVHYPYELLCISALEVPPSQERCAMWKSQGLLSSFYVVNLMIFQPFLLQHTQKSIKLHNFWMIM